jgi:hypothetical protein
VYYLKGNRERNARNEAQRAQRDQELARQRAQQQEAEDAARRAEAADVFSNPQPPTAEEAALLLPIFNDLGEALTKEDARAFAKCFDAGRLFDELASHGSIEALANRKPNATDRMAFVAGFREGAARNITTNPLFQWQQTSIRRIRWSPNRKEAIVIATHTANTELLGRGQLKVRWWLVKQDNDWLVYDYEEFELNLRISTLLSAALSPESMARPQALREAMTALRTAIVSIAQGNVEAAEEAIQVCRRGVMPKPLLAVLNLCDASVHLHKLQPVAALELLENAEKLRPDIPVAHVLRSRCYLLQGEFAKSHESLDKYAAQLVFPCS